MQNETLHHILFISLDSVHVFRFLNAKFSLKVISLDNFVYLRNRATASSYILAGLSL